MKKVFFPGSFNPFTVGHADIVERMLALSKEVVIGIGYNAEKPDASKDINKRAERILDYLVKEGLSDRVSVMCYNGLTMKTAKEIGADCVVRGIRNATDFDYEYGLAAANREVFDIETIFLPADPALGYVSSTIVRDLEKYGDKEDAEIFLP